MSLENVYRGRSLDDWIKTVVDWVNGNGEGRGAEKRIQRLEDNQLSRQDIKDIVEEAFHDEHVTFRKNWNQWVNTGLLVITAVGVLYGIFA
jgi:hypothetical protein